LPRAALESAERAASLQQQHRFSFHDGSIISRTTN